MSRLKAKQNRSSSKEKSAETQSPASDKLNGSNRFHSLLPFILPIVAVTLLPLIITRDHWRRMFSGFNPRSWDGTGHFALFQIYARDIFPDTFGWTHSYFTGMPFPNFYPPLFFWLTAALSHTGLFSQQISFKLVVALPVILMPAVIWITAWIINKENRIAATFAAIGSAVILTDYHFTSVNPLGLDYFSTFQIGMYAQPLGFILLLLWLCFALSLDKFNLKFVIASVLLALIILANFFSAVTTCFFLAAIVIYELFKLRFSKSKPESSPNWNKLKTQVLSGILAICLTAFWLVPMLEQSKYFVTRPSTGYWHQFVTTPMFLWYAFALLGIYSWLRNKPDDKQSIYLIGCFIFFVVIVFCPLIAPSWFPFQANRFIAAFNFLMCLPVGEAISFLVQLIISAVSLKSSKPNRQNYFRYGNTLGIILIFSIVFAAARSARFELAFYPKQQDERLDPVLDYGRSHQDGIYLVEVPDSKFPVALFDARAINSYLGVQGNETLNVVFREAAPNSIFFNPLTNAFSARPDSYGFSSVLADDLDFAEQNIELQLEKATYLGVRYLVIISPWIKEKLDQSKAVVKRNDFIGWSVFELRDTGNEKVYVPKYQPAMVVSSFSVKGRWSDDLSFVRLSEEQFADSWFDMPLVLSPQTKLDKLTDLNEFGSLIIERYDYDDEDAAFRQLVTFAQTKRLILFSDDDALYRKIIDNKSSFNKLTIIDRPNDDPAHFLNNEEPKFRYNNSQIRTSWIKIKEKINEDKILIQENAAPNLELLPNRFKIGEMGQLDKKIPVLIKRSYHPNWVREDNEPVYIASPVFMLTFIDKATVINYERSRISTLAMGISAISLLLLLIYSILKLLIKRSQ